jgi:hypothetical protein
MRTIEDLHIRSHEIKNRIDQLFQEMESDGYFVLTYEKATEIVTLLMEAKNLNNRISYHSILTSGPCSGPH